VKAMKAWGSARTLRPQLLSVRMALQIASLVRDVATDTTPSYSNPRFGNLRSASHMWLAVPFCVAHLRNLIKLKFKFGSKRVWAGISQSL
jgi:hypothetical protein